MSIDTTDWDNQRAFLAVLREGSLSAAARALGVAQPTVRRRLEGLEQAIGMALFTRSPGGLSPTDGARELAAHAETMAAAAEAFGRAASGRSGAMAGAVRISASDVVGVEVLPPLLAQWRAAQPKLSLELSLTNRTEDLLRHEADIAVRMLRPTQAAIVATRAGTVSLGLFATRGHLLRHGTPASLAELRHCAVIGPDRAQADLRLMRAFGLEMRPGEFALRTDNHLAQLAAIRAGLGIGVCQRALAARDPQLVAVLPDQFRAELETWVTMHEDLRRVQRVRATFGHLVEQMTVYCASTAAR